MNDEEYKMCIENEMGEQCVKNEEEECWFCGECGKH